MNILIKFASRGREEWFKRGLVNINDTISGDNNFRILVTADIDDPVMNNDGIRNFCNAFPNVILWYGESKSKVDAINRDMDKLNLEEKEFNWDMLINFSDDMVFIHKHWDKGMVKLIEEQFGAGQKDFFAHFNDGFVNEKLPTMSVMGRKYYERDNYIYHPTYKSVSCDAEAFFVAIMRGKHHYFNWTPFNHMHPANCPGQINNDATYHKNDAISHEDTENYFQRKAICFGVENPVTLPFNPTERC